MATPARIHQICEAFGYLSNDRSRKARNARARYWCPFQDRKCTKVSQHRDFPKEVPFGACSVWHKGAHDADMEPYIICPKRFLQNRTIFRTIARALRLEKPSLGIADELQIPEGRVDYVLFDLDTNDPLAMVEVMACSTTGTGEVLKSLHSILGGVTSTNSFTYGINFRQVLSRMIVQTMSKSGAAAAMDLPMVWVTQDVFARYITETTALKLEPEELPLDKVENDFYLLTFSMVGSVRQGLVLEVDQLLTCSYADLESVFRAAASSGSSELADRVRMKVESDDYETLDLSQDDSLLSENT